VVDPGWRAEVDKHDHLVLTRVVPLPKRVAVGADVDPIMLEVFNNLFMSIAEQMGVTLANTAYSVTIKERLDFSCAVFDRRGQLIANAPHIPVHLGSMGESVRVIMAQNQGRMRPGDVYALNAPYNGGTHLPDVTVITPVFDDRGERILFYVGSRGHHADIGGMAPGSMPADSVSVEQEGVLIDNFKLVDRGQFRERELLGLLSSGPWPARIPVKMSPICRPRSPPTKRALRNCGGWWPISARTWWTPTCNTCRIMPKNSCGGCWRCWREGRLITKWTTAR
jgi:5-oxoprolinase (ATP-hydrolysing)